MRNNFSNLDLSSIGENDAKVTENMKVKENKKSRAKTLRSVPSIFFEAHENLIKKGDTSLDFSSYIVEAIREKLKRDNAF